MTTRLGSDNSVLWFCPGCKHVHKIQYGSGSGPRWNWNGDQDKPTFTPSVLVTWPMWKDNVPVKQICHSFVTDGVMQFLGDCTHELAGQSIPIPDWPYTPEQFHVS